MKELVQIFDDTTIAAKTMIIGILMLLIFPIRLLNWMSLSIMNLLIGGE